MLRPQFFKEQRRRRSENSDAWARAQDWSHWSFQHKPITDRPLFPREESYLHLISKETKLGLWNDCLSDFPILSQKSKIFFLQFLAIMYVINIS